MKPTKWLALLLALWLAAMLPALAEADEVVAAPVDEAIEEVEAELWTADMENAGQEAPEIAEPNEQFLKDGVFYRYVDSTEHTLAVAGCDTSYTHMHIYQHFTSGSDIHWRVTSIDAGAFQNCTRLQQVTVYPDSNCANYIETIGAGAFDGCINLEKVNVPEALKKLFANALYSQWAVDDFEFSLQLDGETGEFGLWLDGYTGDAQDCYIPTASNSYPLRHLGNSAFFRRDIRHVTIPDTVRTIGKDCFRESGLVEVKIPSGVSEIQFGAFTECPGLVKATIQGCEVIGEDAFANCPSLEAVTLGEGVVRIGTDAFAENVRLAAVALPNSVETVDDFAFYNDTALANVNLGTGVRRIGLMAFSQTGISGSLVIPDSVQAMETGAFADCVRLEEVTVGAGLPSVPEGAFCRCAALRRAIIKPGPAAVREGAFLDCNALEFVSIPASVTAIDADWRPPADLIVRCVEGSYAQSWAKARGVNAYIGTSDSPVLLKKCSIAAVADKTYTGKAIKPEPAVKYGGSALAKGTDYTLSYKANKNVGLATVTVKGKGKYVGSVSKTFRIKPKKVALSSLTAGKKQLTVKWKKTAGAGYQLQYSLKSSFSSKKTVTITSYATVKKVIKGLKSGKTYYVRIRGYKKVNGKAYYSAWSKALKKKVK